MSERTTTPRRTSASPGEGGEPPRKSLTERLQSTLSNAAEEHRANASTSETKVRRPGRQPGRQPRRARLRLTRIDPWSVMKTSFLLSVAFGVVTFVAIFMVWSVLGAAGVWDSINSAVASIVEGDSGNSTFDVTDYVGMSRVLGFTLLVSVVDVILLTALATLTAFLYNLAAALLGGIEVTLAEDEK
ncbi:Transmembrane protein of unknown function [Nocardioides exalbidus]|uniref:DUF3566 domain-containing protein n=1 Tax=Nocardioides exalbidus TaxID=402596 RepID=A0A1H4P1J8_9ACTN|nr:DUF3566 domain-containing protein [Nocardioides exalbidus]SEC01279.1 Transmembrane protein of unknown function [Nocardioides exalbidus]